MDDFVLISGAYAAFFLILYFKMKVEHSAKEKAAEPIAFMEQVYRLFAFCLGAISLFLMLSFAMLGAPTTTEIVNNTYANFTQFTNSTACAGGFVDIYGNCTGVGASGTNTFTTQNLVVLNSSTKTITQAYSSAQTNFQIVVFTVVTYLLFAFGLIYALSLVVRGVTGLTKKFDKTHGGDYD